MKTLGMISGSQDNMILRDEKLKEIRRQIDRDGRFGGLKGRMTGKKSSQLNWGSSNTLAGLR
jgi:hypothetical protein